jgi:hypothetical protein
LVLAGCQQAATSEMDEEHRCDSRLPLFVDASASIGPDNVAGLDDQQQRNRAGDRRPLGHRDAEQSGGAEARDPSGRAPREAAVPLSPFRGTPSHSDPSPPCADSRLATGEYQELTERPIRSGR